MGIGGCGGNKVGEVEVLLGIACVGWGPAAVADVPPLLLVLVLLLSLLGWGIEGEDCGVYAPLVGWQTLEGTFEDPGLG